MLLLGIDVGTSSIKIAVVDAETQRSVASVTYPEDKEREIKSLQAGWAEQQPELWWQDVKAALQRAQGLNRYDPSDIQAIGITYQMHGLVLVDKDQRLLRDSIIWCDSRAIVQGERALHAIGEEKCLTQLLNFPGNFTASKLAWVKENEPEIYAKIDKIMLPGDYIAMRLTGEVTSTVSMLSEGVFWDFKNENISEDILGFFDFDKSLFPETKELFSTHGTVTKEIARELGIPAGIPVTYKAGDQPNNALSLSVLQPGEVATTAGTSGVIYAVTDKLVYDKKSRINTFAHVNYTDEQKRLGVLLCINGTGISNRWIKNISNPGLTYQQMNDLALQVNPGADGLQFLPFGNGAERMLCNEQMGAHFSNIDLNKHTAGHIYRAVHEGIAFSFRYGLDIMRENDIKTTKVKAGKANMFLSKTFTQAFVNSTGLSLELYKTDGSVGAALGAGIGAGIYKEAHEAFAKLELLETIHPGEMQAQYEQAYIHWKAALEMHLNK